MAQDADPGQSGREGPSGCEDSVGKHGSHETGSAALDPAPRPPGHRRLREGLRGLRTSLAEGARPAGRCSLLLAGEWEAGSLPAASGCSPSVGSASAEHSGQSGPRCPGHHEPQPGRGAELPASVGGSGRPGGGGPRQRVQSEWASVDGCASVLTPRPGQSSAPAALYLFPRREAYFPPARASLCSCSCLCLTLLPARPQGRGPRWAGPGGEEGEAHTPSGPRTARTGPVAGWGGRGAPGLESHRRPSPPGGLAATRMVLWRKESEKRNQKALLRRGRGRRSLT